MTTVNVEQGAYRNGSSWFIARLLLFRFLALVFRSLFVLVKGRVGGSSALGQSQLLVGFVLGGCSTRRTMDWLQHDRAAAIAAVVVEDLPLRRVERQEEEGFPPALIESFEEALGSESGSVCRWGGWSPGWVKGGSGSVCGARGGGRVDLTFCVISALDKSNVTRWEWMLSIPGTTGATPLQSTKLDLLEGLRWWWWWSLCWPALDVLRSGWGSLISFWACEIITQRY